MNRIMLTALLGTELRLPHHAHPAIAWIDRTTLVAVLSGASHLGAVACGYDVTVSLGQTGQIALYGLIGLSALWQWSRQRF